MANQFIHTAHRNIWINDLCLPVSFFQKIEPDYSLPVEANSREYIPSQVHALYGNREGLPQFGGEFPWIEGDRYLASIETYRELWLEEQANKTQILFPSDPAPPLLPTNLHAAIAVTCAQIVDYAVHLRARIAGPISHAIGTWLEKEREAKLFLATAQLDQVPFLRSESLVSGKPIEALAQEILAKATAYRNAEAVIAGMTSRHTTAVRALESIEAVRDYQWQTDWLAEASQLLSFNSSN